jgi:predicted GNAT family acetyltransferase
LRAAGFVEEARQPLMVCTRETVRAAPPVQGLHVTELERTALLAEMQVFLAVQHRGFDPKGAGAAGEGEARDFARTLGQGRAFVAWLRGEAVAAGMYSAPLKVGPQKARIAELAGLATLAPFRRQGIATALAARAVQSAFARGVDAVCLSAADERAGRVYERVGFCTRATMLAYVDALETGFLAS